MCGTGAGTGTGADTGASSLSVNWLRGLGSTTAAAAADISATSAAFGCFTVVGDDDSEVEMCSG